jgi:TRAP transporter TAXI family solute receptor
MMTGLGAIRKFARARLCAALCTAMALTLAAATAEEPGETQEPPGTYFRIGTGSLGGTYFPIGGLIADVLTFRHGGSDCANGGCGVPGLVAVAQVTQGSVENVIALESGTLESATVQADVAYWMYVGQWIFSTRPPARSLRAIANLYTESIHLVARRDAGIRSVADLKGKRVSFGEHGSGTDVDARIVLGGFGLTEADVTAEHLGPSPSAEMLRTGKLDAFFLVSGTPASAVSELAEATEGSENAITLVPVMEVDAARIREAYPFYKLTVIPGDTYRGIGPTATLGVSAEWLVSDSLDAGLVYEITRALWHKNARALLDTGHPEGRNIRIENALTNVTLPLHPGAARYYREAGLLKE